jgi:hypothetical protein
MDEDSRAAIDIIRAINVLLGLKAASTITEDEVSGYDNQYSWASVRKFFTDRAWFHRVWIA